MAVTTIVAKGLSVVITREFDTPNEVIYDCWTDPQKLVQWWGPHGMRTSAELDVRPGGMIKLTMHASDGTGYPLTGKFLEVVENFSLVMELHLDDHPANWHDYLAEAFRRAGGDEDTLPSLTVITRVTFDRLTSYCMRLTVEQTYATAAERDAFADMGNGEGWDQSFQKLEACVERL